MALKETIMLSESLPKCAGIFRSAGEINSPDWVIVHFHVSPDEAEVTDMRNVSQTFANRTRALFASASRAKELCPKPTEKGAIVSLRTIR